MASQHHNQDGAPHGSMVAQSKMATSDAFSYTSAGELTPQTFMNNMAKL